MLLDDNKCPFCNEFDKQRYPFYFKDLYGFNCDVDERCILDTDNFACVPSIGSFVEGYILVIPKQHFLSSFTMPESHIIELLSITHALSRFYRHCYHQNYIMYEHGTADTANVGGMSVVHAHLHCMPCSHKIISNMYEYDFIRFDSFFEAQKYYLAHSRQAYLLLKDIDNSFYLSISDNIPSQYFRTKVCDTLGIPGTGDWRKYPYFNNLKKTFIVASKYGLNKTSLK